MTKEEFGRHYERLYARTVKYLLGLHCKPDDAEDVAQSAWTKAWEKRDQFRGESTFATWMFTICRHHWYMLRRDKMRAASVDIEEAGELTTPANQPSHLDRVVILKAVDTVVNPLFRSDFAMMMQGHTGEEISAITGVHVKTIRCHIHRARVQLRLAIG